MYERMLDKQCKPSETEFADYCGNSKELLKQADDFLLNELNTEKLLRFPYGKTYGWGMKYFIKSKHICDLFAEKNAFTIMIRLTNSQIEKAYSDLTDSGKTLVDNKYPCGDGGWIHYRILTEQHLNDIKLLLKLKTTK